MSQMCAAALRPVRRWSGALAVALPFVALLGLPTANAQAQQTLLLQDAPESARPALESELARRWREERGVTHGQ